MISSPGSTPTGNNGASPINGGSEVATHTWQPDSTGRPDAFAFDVEHVDMGHNGPRCTVCGFFFCECCWPEGWQHKCPGTPPQGMEYDWIGGGTTREPEEIPDLAPRSPRPRRLR